MDTSNPQLVPQFMALNKKAIVFAALANYVGIVKGTEPETGDGTMKKAWTKSRKELLDIAYEALIAAGVSKHDIKPNVCPAYLNMAKMRLIEGRSEYSHHKHHKIKMAKANGEVIPTKPEVIPMMATGEGLQVLATAPIKPMIPDGCEWKAINGDKVEYFLNRKMAMDYQSKNGGKEVWKVSKITEDDRNGIKPEVIAEDIPATVTDEVIPPTAEQQEAV